jgi:hypothetical protein
MALVPSARYPSQIDIDAAYPQGKARNSGAFQDGTGTPLEKDWLNDLFGFEQALLDAGEVTPSGTPDAVGASDYLDAMRAVIVRDAKTTIDPQRMHMRQLGIETPFSDTGASMAAVRMSNGRILVIKSGTDGVHEMSTHDDLADEHGSLVSITSLVTDVAGTGATRIVAIGTGGNRCCYSDDFGATWIAGSDLGATPERIIYNATHTRYMATFAAGVNVAQDVDAASTWASVSSGLTSAQGGIAHFSNGDTLVCGLDASADVGIARSTNGGTSWAATATVPNPGDYTDSGTIAGDGGSTIYHAGRVGPAEIRICATSSAMSWSLLASLNTLAATTFKPRILLCPFTGVLFVVVGATGGSTVAFASRDGGVTWSERAFYRTRFNNSFGVASGRLYSTTFGALYATDILT